MDFTGKVAIVTGAGKGIGRGIAELFAERGAAVVLAEVNPQNGRLSEKALAERFGPERVAFIETDVADEPSVTAMIEKTIDRFGRVDFLVNNAAIGRGGPVTELSLADWNRVLAVDLTGPFLCSKHAAKALARVKGAIVNIASTRALMSEPNTEAYSACKGGVVALTHALAMSLGPGVRVNCISPGWIDVRRSPDPAAGEPEPISPPDHAQHPAGRVGTPRDIAEMAAHLCSEAAGFITGQNFVVDGGMTKKMIYIE